jgi:hypothetical protein
MKITTAIVAIEALRASAIAERKDVDPHDGLWSELWARSDAYTIVLDLLDAIPEKVVIK